MKNSIAEISAETLRIEEELKLFNPGQRISYHDLEKRTGVKMNYKGKQYLRAALRRSKLEYMCIYGEGIELASENTATTIISHKLVRIDNSVKRGEKTYKNVSNQFYDKLSPIEQKQINFVGAAFGAIRLAANNSRQMIREVMNGNSPQTPMLPKE